MYQQENYPGRARFPEQYREIRAFLQAAADTGYNEHFHYGRFAWMMAHSYLDTELLPSIALFRNGAGQLVGAALFDTDFHDRWYIVHSLSDESLLAQMVAYVTETDTGPATIKANQRDTVLCRLLENAGFQKQSAESVLQMDLSRPPSFSLPPGFSLTAPDCPLDNRQWQLVIHRGFDHEGPPPELSEEAAQAQKHLEAKDYMKVFAVKDGEYTAHCGVWYSGGETAYIEPVVTVPAHRGKGLGRAVVYEALRRAREQGAKRAIVLSDQKFYTALGMTKSSETVTWAKK